MLPMVIEEINLQKCCSQINIIFSERQFLHKFEKSMDLIPLFFFNLSKVNISSVQFSHSVMSNSSCPMNRSTPAPPCPSPTPGVHSDSRPSSQVMPSNHLILCRSLLLLPPIPPSITVFSNESTLPMRWPNY